MLAGKSIDHGMRFLGWWQPLSVHAQWGTLPPPVGYVPPGRAPPSQPQDMYWAPRKERVLVFPDGSDQTRGSRVIAAPRYDHKEAVRCHRSAEGDIGADGTGAVAAETKRANGPLPGACARLQTLVRVAGWL